MTAALQGIRVLDLSRYAAGAYYVKLLATFRAELIKVEPPCAGDPTCAVGPFLHDRPAHCSSLNTGKQGLTLNLKHPQSQEILKALVRHTDVLQERMASIHHFIINPYMYVGPHSKTPWQSLSTRPPDYHLSLQGRPDLLGRQHPRSNTSGSWP